MKTLIESTNRSPLRCGFFTMTIALCWFALSPPLKAQDCPSTCPGGGNTGLGVNALNSVIPGTGINNTAAGANALSSNTTGTYNVGIGSGALANNTTGDFNMAIGAEALNQNNGTFNLAIGFRVGYLNTTGRHLTGIGAAAMRNNTTGEFNTAIGADALRQNATSGLNVAVGDSALASFNDNVDGGNAALGSIALTDLATGIQNTAVGRRALEFSTSGSNNTALGWRAGDNVTTASGVVCIGANVQGANDEDNRTFVRNLTNNQVQTFNPPTVRYVTSRTADGRLGVTSVVSSRRYKYDIKPMEKVSEAILKLKPVTFHLKKEVDTSGLPGFGLIAEDVEDINPDLVYHDEKGRPESVRYDAVNALLLNEFLKEHKKVEEQQASITDLKSTVAVQQKEMQVLTAQLKEQAAQIQKVSAKLEMRKPDPKVVINAP